MKFWSKCAASCVIIALATAAPAAAQPIEPFSTTALQAAQAAGKPVLVDVFASWCPTCRAQAPTIESLPRDAAFSKVVILRLDFDRQTAEERQLGVRVQSTLIAFRGAKETARAVDISDPGEIRALAATALR